VPIDIMGIIAIAVYQWFINYCNKKWKGLAHQCLNQMDIVPEELRQEFRPKLIN
jgi:leucyl-tRNA synthetase